MEESFEEVDILNDPFFSATINRRKWFGCTAKSPTGCTDQQQPTAISARKLPGSPRPTPFQNHPLSRQNQLFELPEGLPHPSCPPFLRQRFGVQCRFTRLPLCRAHSDSAETSWGSHVTFHSSGRFGDSWLL